MLFVLLGFVELLELELPGVVELLPGVAELLLPGVVVELLPMEPLEPLPDVSEPADPEMPASRLLELPEVLEPTDPELPLEPEPRVPLLLDPEPVVPVEPVADWSLPLVLPVPMLPLLVEPLTDGEVAVPVDEVSEPVPSVPELELPLWPVALPVPVPDPAVPAVPALVPPVLPVDPELPLPPVCAIAPAATSAAAEKIVAASFPMFMNFLLVRRTVAMPQASGNPRNTRRQS